MQKKKLIAGNWKMNGSLAETKALLTDLRAGMDTLGGVDMLVCPPFVHLECARQMLSGSPILLGAQAVSRHAKGAYTGQVSAAMLLDLGCTYVLVGHSECRQYCLETDPIVGEKFVAAQRLGLTPILCVGETLQERQAGQMEAVVKRQLEAVLSLGGNLSEAIVAYEPVWAIGSGLSATPEDVQAMHAFIRQYVQKTTPLLYGGSVKAENAALLLGLPDVDGCLVGGASLVAAEFLKICERASSQ